MNTSPLISYLRALKGTALRRRGVSKLPFLQGSLIAVIVEYLCVGDSNQTLVGREFVRAVDEAIGANELAEIIQSLPFPRRSLPIDQAKALAELLFSESLRDVVAIESHRTPPSLLHSIIDSITVDDIQTVYDPMCGIGSFFVELRRRYPSKEFRFVGREVDAKIRLLCLSNLLIHGIGNADIQLENVNLPRDEVEFADLVFADPADYDLETESLVRAVLSAVKPTSSAIVVVPNKFLSSEDSVEFRSGLVGSDVIEKVIAFKDSTVHQSRSILTLRKMKSVPHQIVFDGIDFDEPEAYESNRVHVSQLTDADIRPERYALVARKDVLRFLDDSDYPICCLWDLLDDYFVGTDILEKKGSEETERLPLVRAMDLLSDLSTSSIELKNLTRVFASDDAVSATGPMLLVSLLGKQLRPSLLPPDASRFMLGTGVMALKPKAGVDCDYLRTQLGSKVVTIQITQLPGYANGLLSVEELLGLKLQLPPLVEQMRKAIASYKSLQVDLNRNIDISRKETKAAEYDVIRVTVHDFNHMLDPMQKDLMSLKSFLESKSPHLLEVPVTNTYPGDSEADIDPLRLKSVLGRLIRTWKAASEQLALTREELQNNDVKPSRRNFNNWLESEVKPLFAGQLEFLISGESVEFDFDEKRFRNLVRNLVTNAIQNGSHRVVFETAFKYFDDKQQIKEGVKILFKNDGEPFPEDFDFEVHFKGLYKKASSSKGSGIGGYSINKTVELHNGSLTNVSPKPDSEELFPVQIEIVIPIDFSPNPNYVRSNPYTTSR